MRFVILGSGRGSNAEALLKAWSEGRLGRAQPVGIFSDNPEARILSLGATYGVPAKFLSAAPFKTKLEGPAEQAYIDEINALAPDLVVLAGFMRVLKPAFIGAFKDRIINLHPSLLPSFKGLDGIGQALAYGVRYTGCTVHWVNLEVDGGRIIDQAAVRIEDGDTHDSLAARIHAEEHRLLCDVVRRLAEKGRPA